jgi:hypothetical protein
MEKKESKDFCTCSAYSFQPCFLQCVKTSFFSLCLSTHHAAARAVKILRKQGHDELSASDVKGLLPDMFVGEL